MIGIHITAAILSIVVTTVALFRPTRIKLYISYGLAGMTVATGLSLVVVAPAHMLQACVVGTVYVATVFPLIAIVRRRLIHMLAIHK